MARPIASKDTINFKAHARVDSHTADMALVTAVHSGGMPLLERVMASLMLCLQRDAEMRSDEFNGRPYYRIILGFIQEMCQSPAPDAHSFGLLSAIATALLSVQPLQTPSFAFPWLELISHRWGWEPLPFSQKPNILNSCNFCENEAFHSFTNFSCKIVSSAA